MTEIADRRFDRNWLIVAALSVFAWAPLLYPGFFQSGSGFAALYRVAQPDATAAFFPGALGENAPLAYALARLLDALGMARELEDRDLSS